jgi:hypothetical protein
LITNVRSRGTFGAQARLFAMAGTIQAALMLAMASLF